MFSYGESVYLAGCTSAFTPRQTRNDSGSLTLSLPGSVTARKETSRYLLLQCLRVSPGRHGLAF